MQSRLIFAFSIIFSLLLTSVAYSQEQNENGLELYVVRHAETEGNRTHIHTRENDRTFSATGLNQVKILTDRLGDFRFDAVIVSPKYRAMNTIFPYLKRNNLVAEIWPELEECCWQKEGRDEVSAGLERGKKIDIPPEMRPYFRLRDENSGYKYKARNYADGILQMQMASDMIRQRFSQSGKTVLLVGHYHAGGRIMEILQGLKPEGQLSLENTKISRLVEMPDGRFQILSLNR